MPVKIDTHKTVSLTIERTTTSSWVENLQGVHHLSMPH